jgi:hypothetical protein
MAAIAVAATQAAAMATVAKITGGRRIGRVLGIGMSLVPATKPAGCSISRTTDSPTIDLHDADLASVRQWTTVTGHFA